MKHVRRSLLLCANHMLCTSFFWWSYDYLTGLWRYGIKSDRTVISDPSWNLPLIWKQRIGGCKVWDNIYMYICMGHMAVKWPYHCDVHVCIRKIILNACVWWEFSAFIRVYDVCGWWWRNVTWECKSVWGGDNLCVQSLDVKVITVVGKETVCCLHGESRGH